MKKQLPKYLILCFAISWLCWGVLALLTYLDVLDFNHPAAVALHIAGGFGPTFAGIWVRSGKFIPTKILPFIFKANKKTFRYLLLLIVMLTVMIALSSLELTNGLDLLQLPLILLGAVFIYGGNEEVGWRGVMQADLEKNMPFPFAAIITGAAWGVWHLPLWFIEGTSQQGFPFWLYLLYAIFLSFLLAALYKRSGSVFYCGILHGFSNFLLTVFVLHINFILSVGMMILLITAVCLWYPKWTKSK
ncbi:MAG: CPBP family intramembrane metalloprotease [Oscillospiraceae bacterium]|nr:CPBP family intramembrane metalloprotease [Oscillospiraceae bacterium]